MAPGRKTGGRKKGTPNKDTAEVRAMVTGALNKLGGRDWLVEKANDAPQAFMALIGKLIPAETKTELTGGVPITIQVTTGVSKNPASES